jgi:hypothetical protein
MKFSSHLLEIEGAAAEGRETFDGYVEGDLCETLSEEAHVGLGGSQ